MWVAFHTFRTPDGQLVSDFAVLANEALAVARYDFWRGRDDCICAGVAPITHATEPHWIDGE